MTTLGEELPKEQARVREILGHYKEIGPAGMFGARIRHLIPNLLSIITEYKGLKESPQDKLYTKEDAEWLIAIAIAPLNERSKQLRADNERLREALDKYGQHRSKPQSQSLNAFSSNV